MDRDEVEKHMDANANDVDESLFLESGSENEVVSTKPAATSTRSKVASSDDHSGNPKKRRLTSLMWNEMVRRTINGGEITITNRRGEDSLTMERWSFNQETSRQKLAKAIIVHEYPISMVEDEYFREYISSIQPLINHMSCATLEEEIMSIYNREKEELKVLLEGLNSRVAITCDMWTSNQKNVYMAVTAHFIDNNWRLQGRILNFVSVPTPHTDEILADCLFDSLMAWSLDVRLSTITVDNCAASDAMITSLMLKLQRDELILQGKVLHMHCYEYILDLIVKEGLAMIESTIERIRDSVVFWSTTPPRVEKFEEACKQLDVLYSKKLCLDCQSRWNSTYDMLVTAIGYKEVFHRLQHMDTDYKCLPTDDDWELVDKICKKLAKFYKISNRFSSTQYQTGEDYLMLFAIREVLVDWKGSFDVNISTMIDKMFEKFEKYWDDIHIIMAVCAVLDPRYKMEAVDYVFSKVYGADASMEIQNVKNTCYELFQEYQSRTKSRHSKNMGSSSCLVPSAVGDDNPLTSYTWKSRFRQYLSTITTDSQLKSELDRYLEGSLLPLSDDFDILDWWKLIGTSYPTLQEIARDMLAVPMSTVSSGSTSNINGRIINSDRSHLNPDLVEALMCTQVWLSNKKRDTEIIEEEDELNII